MLIKDKKEDVEECLNYHTSFIREVYANVEASCFNELNKLLDKYEVKRVYKPFSNDFSYERNVLHDISCTDYVLHIDVDERFCPTFLKKVRTILKKNEHKAYNFPRVNLPRFKNYPDPQTRLLKRRETLWERRIHEIVKDKESNENIEKVDCYCLSQYPILHFTTKKNRNKRWIELEILEKRLSSV